MKLFRHGLAGKERPGLVDEHGVLRDLTGILQDIDGSVLTADALSWLRQLDATTLPEVASDTRFGPPVNGIGKFICVGLNFADHARESGMPLPEQPIIFMKATSAVCGPNDPLLLPPDAEKVDWEVELGVVIGDMARHVPVEKAMDHVAGYCVIHDVSERAFQLEHGGQWVKGKSYDSFGPMGPYLVTQDEIADPHDLSMKLSVNGELMQDGTSADMVFRIPQLVSIISRYMTLQPGDVISTGTPAGVGLGMSPQRFLREGDSVELSIAGLGSQHQVTKRDNRR